jgi:hypothetical protein
MILVSQSRSTGAQNAQKKKKFLKNPVAKAEKSMEG